MDNAQYAELFLTESREHVTAVNQALLELERDSSGESGALAVGAIFRAVHTIKGMGATMGYTSVAELAHELETVLDAIRRGTLVIDVDAMDVLFQAADALEQAIEEAVGGREGGETAGVLGSLRAMSERRPPRGAAAGGARVIGVQAPDTSGILIRVRLSPDAPLRGVRAFIIVQMLSRIGDVTGVNPPVETLQTDGLESDFALRFVGEADASALEQVIRRAGDVETVQIGDDVPAAATDQGLRPVTPTPSSAPVAVQTRHVRIDVRRLDNLMNLIGELVIARGRMLQLSEAIGNRDLEEVVTQSSALIAELRDEITASRMVRVSQVFDRFPRVVRDSARSVGKQIEFVVEGSDVELDRSMLDEIGDSIIHLLRNAIDHGIEAPEQRVALGKPATGRLSLSAHRDRSAAVIRVSDDGQGIDRARVLARAKRDGLVDAGKQELSEDELLPLLARPGFSTADRVTDLSGRGVGVDAVFTRVRSLGGAMNIRSVPGQGTTMTLRLPLTLAIVRALLARVADETYAIPLAHVSETIELAPDMLRTDEGREMLMARDEAVPLLRLRKLVNLPVYEPPSEIHLEQVVVVDLGDRRAALVIDELSGQEEIVVKQYNAVRDGLPFFGGATLLSDGTPSLIVDVSSLL